VKAHAAQDMAVMSYGKWALVLRKLWVLILEWNRGVMYGQNDELYVTAPEYEP